MIAKESVEFRAGVNCHARPSSMRNMKTESVQRGSLDLLCSIRKEKNATKGNRKVPWSRRLSSLFPFGPTLPASDHPLSFFVLSRDGSQDRRSIDRFPARDRFDVYVTENSGRALPQCLITFRLARSILSKVTSSSRITLFSRHFFLLFFSLFLQPFSLYLSFCCCCSCCVILF